MMDICDLFVEGFFGLVYKSKSLSLQPSPTNQLPLFNAIYALTINGHTNVVPPNDLKYVLLKVEAMSLV